MESTAGKSGALRALLEASAPGRELQNAGICGRLGDLGVVSAEYDVAVRRAVGLARRLQDFLVILGRGRSCLVFSTLYEVSLSERVALFRRLAQGLGSRSGVLWTGEMRSAREQV